MFYLRSLLVAAIFLAVTVSFGDAEVEINGVKGELRSNLIRGFTVTFRCSVVGETFVGWFNESGKKITDKAFVKDDSPTTLTIPGAAVTPYIGGNYSCRGSQNSAFLILEIFCSVTFANLNVQQLLQLGEKGTIQVGCHAHPQPKYEWKKDDAELKFEGPRLSMNKFGTITITNVEKSDQASYKLKTTWKNQISEKTIQVTVGKRPEFTQVPIPSEMTGVTGYNATFCCKATGDKTPTISWTKKTPSAEQLVVTSSKFEIKDGCLIIKTLEDDDVARYICKAKNELGEITTSATIKAVKDPPQITSVLNDVTKQVGEDHTITCTATGATPLSVEWKKDGKAVLNQQKSAGQSVLSFKDLQLRHMATFTCVASNRLYFNNQLLVASKSIKLYVQSKPVLNVQASVTPVYSFIGYKTPVILRCVFSGHPVPSVSMKKDGKEMAKGNSSVELTVTTTKEEEFGNYECEASNSLGSENHVVELKKAEKPEKPTNVLAGKTCREITLTWKPPVSNGGMLISEYSISYGQGEKNVKKATLGEKMRSYTIRSDKATKILPATEYSVSIQARNAVGFSSKKTIQVTTAQYCIPSHPRIYVEGGEQSLAIIKVYSPEIELEWDEPKDVGFDRKVKYRVEWAMKTNPPSKPRKSKTLEATKYTITNLKLGKYEVKVYAINKAGESKPDTRTFEVVDAVKPKDMTTQGPPKIAKSKGGLSKGAVAGIVIAVLLIVLITIDLFCCFFNSCGLIFCFQKAFCGGKGAKYEEQDGKKKDEEMEKLKTEEKV